GRADRRPYQDERQWQTGEEVQHHRSRRLHGEKRSGVIQTRSIQSSARKIPTPANTTSAMRPPGSLFTSGIRSLAATYVVTPAASGSAALIVVRASAITST